MYPAIKMALEHKRKLLLKAYTTVMITFKPLDPVEGETQNSKGPVYT